MRARATPEEEKSPWTSRTSTFTQSGTSSTTGSTMGEKVNTGYGAHRASSETEQSLWKSRASPSMASEVAERVDTGYVVKSATPWKKKTFWRVEQAFDLYVLPQGCVKGVQQGDRSYGRGSGMRLLARDMSAARMADIKRGVIPNIGAPLLRIVSGPEKGKYEWP